MFNGLVLLMYSYFKTDTINEKNLEKRNHLFCNNNYPYTIIIVYGQ